MNSVILYPLVKIVRLLMSSLPPVSNTLKKFPGLGLVGSLIQTHLNLYLLGRDTDFQCLL